MTTDIWNYYATRITEYIGTTEHLSNAQRFRIWGFIEEQPVNMMLDLFHHLAVKRIHFMYAVSVDADILRQIFTRTTTPYTNHFMYILNGLRISIGYPDMFHPEDSKSAQEQLYCMRYLCRCRVVEEETRMTIDVVESLVDKLNRFTLEVDEPNRDEDEDDSYSYPDTDSDISVEDNNTDIFTLPRRSWNPSSTLLPEIPEDENEEIIEE